MTNGKAPTTFLRFSESPNKIPFRFDFDHTRTHSFFSSLTSIYAQLTRDCQLFKSARAPFDIVACTPSLLTMSSVAATRAALRQYRLVLRQQYQQHSIRQASSTSEAASKAKESSSNAISKASQGLSRVTSSAGPAISGAVSGAGNALRKVGGRTGKVIAFVDCMHSLLCQWGLL